MTKDFLVTLIKNVSLLLGSRRKMLFPLLGLFFFASLLDLLGIGLLAPYVTLLSNQDKSGILYQTLSKYDIQASSEDLLIYGGILLFFVFAFKTVCAIFVNTAILSFSFGEGARLRSRLMRSYQNMPYATYIERNSSEYVYHIETLANKFSQGFLQSLLRTTSESILLLIVFSFLAWKNFPILVLLSVVFGGAVFIYDRCFRNRVTNYGRLINGHSTKMLQSIHEGLEGFKEVRILGKEDYFLKSVIYNAKNTGSLNTKLQVIGVAPRQLLELLLVTFIVSFVFLSFALDQSVASLLPTLTIFGAAAIRVVPSINQIALGITNIRSDLHSIHLLCADIENLKDEEFLDLNKESTKKDVSFESIELRNVEFSYSGAKKKSLNGISLKIKRGECIGVIGSSGAGKTTLIDVLLGLLEPQKGNVFLNGSKLNENFGTLRKQIAYLPQQIFLIDNTLKANIALGVKEEDIDEKKVYSAIEQVHLTELVAGLANGLETIVGERGIQLSGGQRQRVALARAFYHSRNVLVMDESTSALDNETEREILQQMKELKGVKTMLVIAHRVTTLQHCDRIYRLAHGSIQEELTYEELLKKNIDHWLKEKPPQVVTNPT